MFKKNERLNQSEFSAYFQNGKKHHLPHLTFVTQKREGLKIGVVVGKKVAKSAVRRNMIKRRVYATLKNSLAESDYCGVLIVVVKPTFNSLPRKTAEKILRESIAQVLKSA